MNNYPVIGLRESDTNYFFALLVLLPVIQLGFSYYISIQSLAYIILNIFLIENIRWTRSNTIAVTIFLMFFAAYLFVITFPGLHYYSSSTRDFLRVVREALCVFTLLLTINIIKSNPFKTVLGFHGNIDKSLVYFIYIVFGLTTFQYLLSKINIYITLPTEWFVVNAPKNISNLYELFNLKSRISLSFGEPSYFALLLVGLSAVFLVSNKYNLVALCFIVALMTSSAFGILSILFLTAAGIIEKKFTRGIFLVITFFSFIVLCVLGYVFKDLILEFKGMSAFIRLYAPWYLLLDVLGNIPSGVPFTQLENHINNSDYAYIIFYVTNYIGFDNSIINIFVVYGYFGVILIIFIIALLSSNSLNIFLLFLFVLFCFQNGSIFTFDKITILSFFYLLIGIAETKALTQ